MGKIHRKDFDSYKEYNKARMREYNKVKHYKLRLTRFQELLKVIRLIESEGVRDDAELAEFLAKNCIFKVVLDKDMKGEEDGTTDS